MNSVLMDVVVMLAATVDDVMDDDEYASGAEKVLESMVAEFQKLNADERRELVTHVQAMAVAADRDPTRAASYRTFLAEFPTAFGLVEED